MKSKLLTMGFALFLIILSFSGCVNETPKIESNTIYVNDDGTADYTSIQNAIENASIGDTVYVYSGTYIDDYIRIDKSISLIGENKETTIIISEEPANYASTSPAISVNTNSVTIKGFTIETERRVVPCIYLNSDNNFITDNIIKGDMVTGITIERSSNNVITNNNFTTNGNNGIAIDSEGYYQMSENFWTTHEIQNNYLNGKPIYYYKNNNEQLFVPSDAGQVICANCSNVIITNLNISHAYHGIQLGYSNNIEIKNNHISYCSVDGINLFHSTNIDILDNMITNCFEGIIIDNSNDNVFDNNVFTNNHNGFYQKQSSGNTILNNTLSGSEFAAIYLDSGTTNNVVTRNQILNNNYSIAYGSSCYGNTIFRNNISYSAKSGIWIDPYAQNTIFLNNFIHNARNIQGSSSDKNYWDNGTIGNYWDNYTGSDADGDGIGDVPYVIFGINKQDNYPLMRPVDI